jgi:hypothetical protein
MIEAIVLIGLLLCLISIPIGLITTAINCPPSITGIFAVLAGIGLVLVTAGSVIQVCLMTIFR